MFKTRVDTNREKGEKKMKKNKTSLAVALTAAFLIGVFFTPSAQAANWQPATTITGTGSQTTNEFMVSGDSWRISWSFTPNSQFPSLTLFSFFVYRHGEDAQYLDDVIESGSDQTSGVMQLHGTGLHYVRIEAANTRGYTLTVEYDSDSTVSDSSLALIIALVLGVPIVLIIIMSVILRRKYKGKRATAQTFPPPPPPPS
jgi:hypothetical protein